MTSNFTLQTSHFYYEPSGASRILQSDHIGAVTRSPDPLDRCGPGSRKKSGKNSYCLALANAACDLQTEPGGAPVKDDALHELVVTGHETHYRFVGLSALFSSFHAQGPRQIHLLLTLVEPR